MVKQNTTAVYRYLALQDAVRQKATQK